MSSISYFRIFRLMFAAEGSQLLSECSTEYTLSPKLLFNETIFLLDWHLPRIYFRCLLDFSSLKGMQLYMLLDPMISIVRAHLVVKKLRRFLSQKLELVQYFFFLLPRKSFVLYFHPVLSKDWYNFFPMQQKFTLLTYTCISL